MAGPPISPHADFPGGNIVVDRVEGRRAVVHQNQTGSTERWFYGCFAVRGAAVWADQQRFGEVLAEHVTGALSYDPVAWRGVWWTTSGGGVAVPIH